MKPLTISRASVASSRSDPVQWSSNLQLAINNGSQITLLDPQLPLIHKTVYNIPGQNTNNKVLDCKGLFNISTPVHLDVIEGWPIRSLDHFLLDEGNEPFSIGGIGEPLITRHMWSPINGETRDCLLGVLLNTGELLILERTNTSNESYSIKHNFFDVLSWQNDVGHVSLETESRISLQQYQALRVRSFAFGSLISPGSRTSILGLTLDDNSLAVHSLEDPLPRIAQYHFPQEENVIKHIWAESFTNGPSSNALAVAAVLTAANSIYLCHVKEELKGGFTASQPQSIKKSSRFAISQVQWHYNKLIVITSNELIVYQIDFNSFKVGNTSLRLDYPFAAAGVVVADTALSTKITIAYETGKLLSFTYDDHAITNSEPPTQLSDFVTKSLYKFQLTNSRQSAIDTDKKTDGEVTKPFLNDTVEGNFFLHGISTNNNGIVSLVYRIAPKNVLNYTIMSKYDYSIAFFSLDNLYEDCHYESQSTWTSLSTINGLWMKHYDKVPTFPRLIGEEKDAEVSDFVQKLKDFRDNYFVDILANQLALAEPEGASLHEYLKLNISENTALQSLQVLYVFNIISNKSLGILVQKLPENSDLLEIVDRITTEQASIRRLIIDHVMNTVLTFVQKGGHKFSSELDRYLAISFFHLSLSALFGSNKNIPKEATISIATDYVTEIFSIQLMAEDENEDLALSESGHKWSRCSLTKFPLLELQSNADELKLFNYVICKEEWSDAALLHGLLQAVNHCIFTGNKIYRRD